MSQQYLSISWDHYRRDICNGLSTLQQNGELVDMTLAADGHMVKVHQIVMSLISPYIKELIIAANCPHPVIFLNKISYTTLCSILEFIYKGEVLIEVDTLENLIQAGKELHIRGLHGLQDKTDKTIDASTQTTLSESEITLPLNSFDEEIPGQVLLDPLSDNRELDEEFAEEVEYLDMELDDETDCIDDDETGNNCTTDKINDDSDVTCFVTDDTQFDDSEEPDKNKSKDSFLTNIELEENHEEYSVIDPTVLRYTVSNQGSLQMILNNYIYFLRYASKSASQHKLWRCVEYVKRRCPAYIVSKHSNILRRVAMHTHANHERRILKKISNNEIFDAVCRAEEHGSIKKQDVKNVSETDDKSSNF